MSGDKAFGGVKVPGLRPTHRSSPEFEAPRETGDTPPSQKIRELVRQHQVDRRECLIECRGDIEHLAQLVTEQGRKASSATHVATEAATKASTIETKFNVIIGMIGALALIVLGVVSWLVLQLQQSDDRSREVAEVVAEKAVLAADRRIDERMRIERQETVRTLLAEQAKQRTDPDVVTMARTK
jgi:hypothetical protein